MASKQVSGAGEQKNIPSDVLTGYGSNESVQRRHNEGVALWMLGGLYEIKASAKETNGEMSIVEATIPDGAGAPMHVHNCGEAIFVLEGSLRLYRGDNEVFDAGPGDLVYYPKGTLEGVENVSGKPARVLLIYSPGGMDDFFAEAGEPAKAREIPPASSEPFDLDRITEIAARHGMEVRPKPVD